MRNKKYAVLLIIIIFALICLIGSIYHYIQGNEETTIFYLLNSTFWGGVGYIEYRTNR